MWNRKRKDANEFMYKTQRDPQNEFMAAGRKDVGEGTVKEFGMDMYTLLYLKRITNKDLLYSTGNSARYYVAAWMGGDTGREWIRGHVWLSRFTVKLKRFTTLLIDYPPI